MRVGNNLQWEKLSGEPVTIENVRLTPQSRLFRVQLPFGGIVWNRPVSVVVERAGKREIVTVPDVTLMTSIAFAVSLLALPILIFAVVKGANR